MKRKNGYVLDTTYPAFFYQEMQPHWLNTVTHFLGFKAPDISHSFNYLELACATGTNLLVCAINHPHAQFVGIDYNPEHIQRAKASADALGLKNIKFIHADFESFLSHNTQKFDFIVNHGTFSWISPTHQQQILDIVNQSLNDTGTFYLHYMCYPGSTDLLPIQKLFNLVDAHVKDSSIDSIDVSKKLFADLNAAGAFINNTKIEAIKKTIAQDSAYLAHELLTDHWQPLYSVDVHHRVFQSTQMSYLGSANPCDNMDSISIPAKIQPIIKNTQAPALREYLKDIARDAKQRIDIFQKKPQALNQQQHLQALNAFEFKLLPKAPQKGPIQFNTAIGNINAPAEVITPVLQSLAKNTMKFSDLLNLASFKNNPMFLIETIFLMMNAQYLHPISASAKHLDASLIQKFNQKMKAEHIQLTLLNDGTTAI